MDKMFCRTWQSDVLLSKEVIHSNARRSSSEEVVFRLESGEKKGGQECGFIPIGPADGFPFLLRKSWIAFSPPAVGWVDGGIVCKRFYNRQFAIFVSRMAAAPNDSKASIAAMIFFLLTITRTAHQLSSSNALTVGELKPGVISSAAESFSLGMLYSKRE